MIVAFYILSHISIMTALGEFKPHTLSRDGFVAFDFLQSGKATIETWSQQLQPFLIFCLTCFSRVCEIFAAFVPTAAKYMCSVFGF